MGTHTQSEGGEAAAADRSESADEEKRRKKNEGGGKMNPFSLSQIVLYRGHPICCNEVFPLSKRKCREG